MGGSWVTEHGRREGMKIYSRKHHVVTWITLVVLPGIFLPFVLGGDTEATLRAAEQGDAQAQFELAVMYESGQGMPQDYAEAARWYTEAARQGQAEAQYNLGLMHDIGRGARKSYGEGARWILAAAKQGHAEAQCNIGIRYGTGHGVPQDDKESLRWLRTAAEQGNSEAQYNLGVAYRSGLGVSQGNVQAYLWYSLAASDPADENSDIAVSHRNRLAKKMTPRQIAEAQRLVGEWKRKNSGSH